MRDRAERMRSLLTEDISDEAKSFLEQAAAELEHEFRFASGLGEDCAELRVQLAAEHLPDAFLDYYDRAPFERFAGVFKDLGDTVESASRKLCLPTVAHEIAMYRLVAEAAILIDSAVMEGELGRAAERRLKGEIEEYHELVQIDEDYLHLYDAAMVRAVQPEMELARRQHMVNLSFDRWFDVFVGEGGKMTMTSGLRLAVHQWRS